MVTITPSDRITSYNPDTPTSVFPVGFPIFDNLDVGVQIDGIERTDFTVSATYVDGVSTDASVKMITAVIGQVIVYGNRNPSRTDQFKSGGALPIDNFNYALNRLEIEIQELRRDVNRAVKATIGAGFQNLPEPSDNGDYIGWLNGKLENLSQIALGAAVTSPTLAVGTLAKPYNVSGSGIPGVNIPDQGYIMRQTNGLAQSSGTLRVERFANYTGGTFGYENAALKVYNEQAATATDSFEDALLAQIKSYSNGLSQNCAGRFQFNKYGTAGGWSLANETLDHTGLANPTGPLIGIEQVLAANGTDANNVRQALNILAARPQDDTGAFIGAAAEIASGISINRQPADGALNRFKIGIRLGAFGANTDFDYGLDLRFASFVNSAICLADGHKLSFTANSDRFLRYTAGAMRFNNGSVDHYTIADNGNTNQFGTISINGTQVVTSRRTGWGIPTGTDNRTTFDTASVTLPALAGAVKSLIADLRAHGLIGT